MTGRAWGLVAVLIGFGALTAAALVDVGYWGIVAPHFQTLGAGQVLADLVILATLSIVWMLGDARRSGVPPWPYVVLTLAAGSFGPLLYLLHREWRRPRA